MASGLAHMASLPPRPPPLAQVSTPLPWVAPHVAALPHVADRISECLDGSQCLSLARAASSGSMRLFERVAFRLFEDGVDPTDRAYALAKALEAAIRADDLVMAHAVSRLHVGPLDVRSLQLAMAYGSLELVEWVVMNRHDRLCSEPGVTNLCKRCAEKAGDYMGEKDLFRVASWLIDEGELLISGSTTDQPLALQLAGGLSESVRLALLKSVELVRWCDERGLLSDLTVMKVFNQALRNANGASVEIVRYLLKRGYRAEREDELVDGLIAASCHPNQEELVELVLASDVFAHLRPHFVYASTEAGGAKVLQWDRVYEEKRKAATFFGMSIATSLAASAGHLATMKWLVAERGVTTLKAPDRGVNEQQALEIIQWLHGTGGGRWDVDTMDAAASNGHLQVVQWLHENRSDGCSTLAMDKAAENGHLEVVQWLHANRSEGCTCMAMNYAAARGRLDVVQFLHENRSEGDVSEAMAYAAVNGEMDVVRWCHDHGGCGRCVERRVLEQPMAFNHRFLRAFDPQPLYPLQWLASLGPSAAAVGCATQCVKDQPMYAPVNLAALALSTGDLLLAGYLFEHHRELFTWSRANSDDVLRIIAVQGHLPAIQWLRAQSPQSLDWTRFATFATPETAAWLAQV